jgi:hypothetical protein
MQGKKAVIAKNLGAKRNTVSVIKQVFPVEICANVQVALMTNHILSSFCRKLKIALNLQRKKKNVSRHECE